jgi:hypothetical protein
MSSSDVEMVDSGHSESEPEGLQREDSFLNDPMCLPSEDTEKDEFKSYAHSDPTPIPVVARSAIED